MIQFRNFPRCSYPVKIIFSENFNKKTIKIISSYIKKDGQTERNDIFLYNKFPFKKDNKYFSIIKFV